MKITCDLSHIQFANSHISLSAENIMKKIMLKLEMAPTHLSGRMPYYEY